MLLPILKFPDPQLKKMAEPVVEVNDAIRTIVADMFETMYEGRGIGLAAIQVNILERIIVIDLDEGEGPLCLINPDIYHQEGQVDSDEGCLSFPGVYDKVKRAALIRAHYLDEQGQPQSLEATGLLGICIQHEVDHLNGITFFDHLSPLKQQRIRRKLERNHKRVL